MTAEQPGLTAASTGESKHGLWATFLKGVGSLAMSTAAQRILGFGASTLAARIAGPASFGTYSVSLSTASVIAGYMSLGVGTTAARFVGISDRDTVRYAATLRCVSILAGMYAILAAGALAILASPIAASVLGNAALEDVLRLAAFLAVALVVLDALSGLIIGRLEFRSQLVLSVVLGTALLAALPLSAKAGPGAMVLAHAGAILLAAITTGAVCGRRLRPLPPKANSSDAAIGMGDLIRFGMVQLSTNAGISLATWLAAALITRSDPTLNEMGFYAVGNQVRGLVMFGPGLASQLVLPLLNRSSTGTAEEHHFISGATLFSATGSLIIGGLILITLPLLLVIFGPSYIIALPTVALLVVTAVGDMSGNAMGQYLLAKDQFARLLMMTFWSAAFIVLCAWLVPQLGALGAAMAWLLSHIAAQMALFLALWRRRLLVRRAVFLWADAVLCAAIVASLAVVAFLSPELRGLAMALQGATLVVGACTLCGFRLRRSASFLREYRHTARVLKSES